MDYLSIQEFTDKWKISKRRIQTLCKEGRINGAKMICRKQKFSYRMFRVHERLQ